MIYRSLLALILTTSLTFASAAVNAEQTLNIATDTSYMPFEFKQNGKYVGFDIDIWAEIAKEQGWKYELHPMDFNGIIPALQTRNIDGGLAAMAIREERKKVVDFSAPYYESGHAILVRADNTSIKSWADLDGKVVASKTGTTTIDWIKTHLKPKELQQFPNVDSEFLALQAGRVDAVIEDTPVIAYYVNNEGKGKTRLAGEPVIADPYGFAFQKGSPLVSKVNESLAKMQADGRYAQIYRKWFGDAGQK
ncbi:glutamine ABC transporter substrate-binding protein GlnH [Pseudomonas gingeri]|uniref:glutamine ABC transporter substrate-binding protein GlnH n=1 Tax=Pseudomonas gingeri TaxID=117681 RepID=UPI00159F9628|nr:glutamine ABC transporter substrate-binding protein GlnH [Pseudomonas gingeri]NWD04169.1 glutamine ABC transporter substrate-binding protein GlnH [Pseudomonas gingeri]NWE34199.1 glutamine ABC transporter substrate-binding protein GlnH [Pseudomonas gingeri]NWE56549.1 glutamine ABC transporter substrate-binding protein GlnH [Pseudomonas gingeri]NWF01075.1 glutamine ABC transporter substrate-binding protein GlnH [Pseudomonas gingeri]